MGNENLRGALSRSITVGVDGPRICRCDGTVKDVYTCPGSRADGILDMQGLDSIVLANINTIVALCWRRLTANLENVAKGELLVATCPKEPNNVVIKPDGTIDTRVKPHESDYPL